MAKFIILTEASHGQIQTWIRDLQETVFKEGLLTGTSLGLKVEVDLQVG